MDERLGDPPRILHLTTGDHATGTRLADFLTECGAEVQRCSDVYRGLARLGKAQPGEQPRGQGNSTDAVLVGVDWLSAREFEFFELCASLQNAPAVWVYGGRDAQAKIALGLRLGAELEADIDTLRSAFTRLASARTSPAPDGGASPPAIDKNAINETRPERVPLVACPPMPEVDDAHVGGDDIRGSATPNRAALAEAADDVSGPVPVPWTRRNEGPRRNPPPTSVPQTTSEPADERLDSNDADGPLLTEQELEALVGKPPVAPGARRTVEDDEILP